MTRPDTRRPPEVGWGKRVLRGLDESAKGNAQAFGFSITITVSFGVVDVIHPQPSLPDLIGFAVAAVAAFTLINLTVAWLLPRQLTGDGSSRAMLIATATDFLAVVGGVGAAIGVSELTRGWVAWAVSPFLAALVYVAVQAIEFAVGRKEEDGD